MYNLMYNVGCCCYAVILINRAMSNTMLLPVTLCRYNSYTISASIIM